MISKVWLHISEVISDAHGVVFRAQTASEIGGGCINRAVKLSDGERSYLVKTNDLSVSSMFEAEWDGLKVLQSAGAVRVPSPVAQGTADSVAFLVLEYIPMTALSRPGWARLGEGLAKLHASTGPAFGWHRGNTIGSTPQINDRATDWVAFWRDRRLGYQLSLAARNGLHHSTIGKGNRLLDRLDMLFEHYEPQASLLHGDLWSGNVAADDHGDPVLFDPAVYYGDREADIAMTELFGRFDQAFYDAYQSAWPLDSGYEQRRTLYQLYHILNHFNLFGGGYAGQAGAMIDRLLQR
jgi:protein-ribulosamine 3-kinase